MTRLHLWRAQKLRREASRAEQVIWGHLRGKKFLGLKFRWQHPIGPYVADFACFAMRLVVEVDGYHHTLWARRRRDARRDGWLRRQGWRVVRIPTAQVFPDASPALRRIAAAVSERERVKRLPRQPAAAPA